MEGRGYAGGPAETAAPGQYNRAVAEQQQKALDGLLDHLEKRLAVIAEGVNRVGMFKNRLINPRPQQVGTDKAMPPPNPGSIEGRLHHMNAVTERIGEMLHEVVGELDRAA